MEILNSFKRIFKAETKSEESDGLSVLMHAARTNMSTSQRITVANMEKYLGKYADQAWVFSCIKIIQTKAASVPLKVYKLQGDESYEIKDHPLKDLLDSVNDFMSGYDLMEATHGFIELTGNAYWLLDNFMGDFPTKIYPITPAQIKPIPHPTKLISGYEFSTVPGKVEKTLKPEEILHFKTWNPLSPYLGLAPICSARDSSEMIMLADQYNRAFFQNGAEGGGYLMSEQGIEEEEKKRITSAWNKLFQGARKAFKISILDGGLKYQPASTTHRDMMFSDLKRMSREDVLSVFNIPPIMVGVFDEANYSNAKEQRRIFWKDCIIPRLTKIESVINERLAPIYGKDIFVKHDVSVIDDFAEDEIERARKDAIHVSSGIKTINEVRQSQNLEEVPWGSTWYAPMGLAPVTLPGEDLPANQPQDTPDDDQPSQTDDKPDEPNDEDQKELKTVDADVVRRDAVWVKFKVFTESQERKWAGSLRSLFNDQEREVIENLRSSDWQKTLNQNHLDKMKSLKASIEVILFDRTKAMSVFRKVGSVMMRETISAAAKKEIDDYNLGLDFNISNPAINAWVTTKSFKFSEELNKTTESALRRELSEAISNGEPLKLVEERIANVFDIARGSRTAMIARTEVISANNFGSVEAYKQSGVVGKLEWIATRDDKVRDSHKIDGEQTPVGQKFSNGLKFPGDDAGAAEDVINCRCTVAPVVKEME